MSGSRVMRWIGVAVVLAHTACAGAVPATAEDLRLDSGFSGDGKVTFPTDLGQPHAWGVPEVQVASTPAGELVAATGSTLVRLLPNGQPDAAFGQNGIVVAAQPEGAEFEISAISVDSQGRVLIAGTSTYPALADPPKFAGGAFESWSGPPPTPQLARVVRYLPNGTPDPTFGTGGVIETDFGLPPPTDSSGRSLLPRPWVEATSVAVDSQDRVLIGGGASVRPSGYCIHDSFGSYLQFATYVARLSQSGAPDASFGVGGVTEMRTAGLSSPLRAELATELQVDSSDRSTYLAQPSRFCRNQAADGIVRLSSDGGVEFVRANRRLGELFIADMAIDSRGRVVALELPSTRRPREAMHVRITRIDGHGAVDTTFGRHGHVWVRQPGNQTRLAAVATDAHSRVLLAGVLASRRTIGKDPLAPPRRQRFLLMRLGPHGGSSRSLGRGGARAIGFGSPSHALATDVMVEATGGIVLAGLDTRVEGEIALARLVPGR